MLERGDQVPHFQVTALDSSSVHYVEIWQRKNLLLVSVPTESMDASSYAAKLTDRLRQMAADDVACVITLDAVSGVGRPGVVVADRWGEICFAEEAARVKDLPGPDELIEWLHYLQKRCPECEGEAR